jgi:hypothetical protein
MKENWFVGCEQASQFGSKIFRDSDIGLKENGTVPLLDKFSGQNFDFVNKKRRQMFTSGEAPSAL